MREDTAELATYLLADGQSQQNPSFLQRSRSSIHEVPWSDNGETGSVEQGHTSDTIIEVSEPPSPSESADAEEPSGPSVLSNLLRKSPPQSVTQTHAPISRVRHDDSESDSSDDDTHTEDEQRRHSIERPEVSEQTPLLGRISSGQRQSYGGDIEGQKPQSERRPWFNGLVEVGHKVEERVAHGVAVAINPKQWDRKAIWHNAVVAPASCLPAVAVGLLLNILDALSYGWSSLHPHHIKLT